MIHTAAQILFKFPCSIFFVNFLCKFVASCGFANSLVINWGHRKKTIFEKDLLFAWCWYLLCKFVGSCGFTNLLAGSLENLKFKRCKEVHTNKTPFCSFLLQCFRLDFLQKKLWFCAFERIDNLYTQLPALNMIERFLPIF